ncbi:MAG: SpoIIE family protein phosphatase [Microbispora sp.]|nr:SpoIIE family protein phosphatase [Microbispora sp.]
MGSPQDGSLFHPPGEDLDRIKEGLQEVARHYKALRELLDAVLAINADLDLRKVLHTIVDSACGLVGARYGALGVLNEEGRFTELIVSGYGEDHLAERGDPLPHGGGILGDLIRDPRPLRVDDLTADPRAAGFPEGHPTMTTMLGVPIRIRRTVYGNLYLTDKAGGPFTYVDEEVMTALASAAGVAIENARLSQRLCSAIEDFQHRLLPEMPCLEDWEVETRYQPSTLMPRIGGDWYDLICLPNGVPCLVVGDAMGHDVQAATVMAQISNMLRVIAYDEHKPPSCVLQHLDSVLHTLHGGPIATTVVVRLEPGPAGGTRLRWASAGHLPPLLVIPGEQARYLYADVGVPLGVDPGLPRLDHEEPLPPGATALLYTDGLVEHRHLSLDEGMAQVADVATAHATAPLPRLCDALLARGNGVFDDDVAMLAARQRT